jgi:hypothetical protein
MADTRPLIDAAWRAANPQEWQRLWDATPAECPVCFMPGDHPAMIWSGPMSGDFPTRCTHFLCVECWVMIAQTDKRCPQCRDDLSEWLQRYAPDEDSADDEDMEEDEDSAEDVGEDEVADVGEDLYVPMQHAFNTYNEASAVAEMSQVCVRMRQLGMDTLAHGDLIRVAFSKAFQIAHRFVVVGPFRGFDDRNFLVGEHLIRFDSTNSVRQHAGEPWFFDSYAGALGGRGMAAACDNIRLFQLQDVTPGTTLVVMVRVIAGLRPLRLRGQFHGFTREMLCGFTDPGFADAAGVPWSTIEDVWVEQ